jgi:hypothetical protein
MEQTYTIGDLIEYDNKQWYIDDVLPEVCTSIVSAEDGMCHKFAPTDSIKLIRHTDKDMFKLGSIEDTVVSYFKDRDCILIEDTDGIGIYNFSRVESSFEPDIDRSIFKRIVSNNFWNTLFYSSCKKALGEEIHRYDFYKGMDKDLEDVAVDL